MNFVKIFIETLMRAIKGIVWGGEGNKGWNWTGRRRGGGGEDIFLNTVYFWRIGMQSNYFSPYFLNYALSHI
jgi:hypothetical protein